MANSSPFQAVIFRIGDVHCALPAGIVREVLPRVPAIRIPGASASVDGLVNVRGALVTVLDGHAMLRQSPRRDDDGAILLLDADGRRCGLAVGQVLDFVELPGGDEDDGGGEAVPAVDPSLVRGVAVQGGRRFVLLDVASLLTPFTG